MKNGLAAPLRGMGTAFSSSLLGLGGSLVLGFLELQASHAHGRFYNQLEEWLSGITELAPGSSQTSDYASRQLYAAMHDMHRAVLDLTERVGTIPRGERRRAAGRGGGARISPRASTSSCARCAPSRRSCASGSTSRPLSNPRSPECSRTSPPTCDARARADGALALAQVQDSYGLFWPGYVDVLSTLLLVVTFLLSVFMVAQFYVSQDHQARIPYCAASSARSPSSPTC